MLNDFLPISPALRQVASDFTLPEPLGFGTHVAPIMVTCDFTSGAWQEARIAPFQAFSILPSAKILHYGQQIFEGMKAYRYENGHPRLFRPLDNLGRFNASARRMAMPEIPSQIFMSALGSMVHYLRGVIPQGVGESLYIRPVMMALDSGLSLAPSQDYRFYLIASPSGSYFAGGDVHALIERSDCRAAPGGTGSVKTAGNYGGSIKSAIHARSMGYQQTLWLDARHQKFVEEFSGMNMFAVRDGILYTPELNSTILPGITRDSVIKLARSLGYDVREEAIDIDELVSDIKSGICSELFACGTAAIITPVAALGEYDGTLYTLQNTASPVAMTLRTRLLEIQIGLADDPFHWSQVVAPKARTSETSAAAAL
ncbi:branched-chain amino acid aminotransferase [Pseudobacteriovorax antillogorgiicola]|uniref:Branched-chain-amino-acid aminotransferase n=1 Tax=Pseudobacteriovorax antillogorgiicola TaxID=1513793 RepID=A0A1Y6BJ57_9BACT|nr:branched-chain amino acid aminotransferase [Pseudobacteriovorax antillogorgiicola]TCS55338.1 branched-chain amino acid aminotransferase [Pseudobacteriovorax antillogorgiicola]SMF13992.1 branched-chain amino acid aminotransferase [Pseudobacteriovorax antillogorgiicola]